MMSVANAWLCGGASAAWVRDNWKYVREAVRWIDWTMAHPDLSFNEHGLMYGETEGGMMEFTMFNNMPCFLGLRMYASMAEKAGRSVEAVAGMRSPTVWARRSCATASGTESGIRKSSASFTIPR